MKRIEKDIKKNSTQRIESSLPEISELDSIPVKAKNTNHLPLCFIPVGVAVAVIIAVAIPLSLKGPASTIQPSNTVDPYHPGNNDHKYNYNSGGYQPALDSFNEFAYYSYLSYRSESGVVNNTIPSPKKMVMPKNGKDDEESEEPTAYEDKYGRTHYPIELDDMCTFSNFLFFEFDATNSEFLYQRIGNGHIRGLALNTNIFGEDILILKNGDNYYSCLINGAGSYNHGTKAYMEFSAHKTIEGFDVVKDTTNKRYLTLTFDGDVENEIHYNELSSISIESDVFNIDISTVLYDNVTVNCTIDELREQLALDPDFQYVDEYGGNDKLVYDASNPETSTFTLEEFTGEFAVAESKLYLGETKILDLNGTSKIYASEINKDAHRELVFETLDNSKRMFAIYDVTRNTYLYYKAVSEINSAYDCYLGLRDDRLVVKLFEPGQTSDDYLIDYGYFGYLGKDGISILWQNLYELASFKLNNVLEIDGVTPVESRYGHYAFKSNTPYIIEIKMSKYGGSNNALFPDESHPIKCRPFDIIDNMPNKSPEWNLLSGNNGLYRYQITFQESGYSYYYIFFNRYSFELKAAVDVELPQ